MIASNDIGYKKEMTLFYLLYYICIFTIIAFYECNYVKRTLKEMFFWIKCFIMKLAFYHLASYPDELWIAAGEIIVDIMDVQTDDWVAVTWKQLFSRRCFQCAVHPFLSLHPLNHFPHIFNGDRSLCKIGYKGRMKNLPKLWGMGEEGGWIEVRGGLSYIFISIAVKSSSISPYIWLEQEAVAFSPYIFTYIPIFQCMYFMIANYSVYYPAECMLFNYEHPTALQAFFSFNFPTKVYT